MNNSTDLLGFNLLYKLGQGAFSTSYLAEQSGKMVAIKVIEIPNSTTSREMSPEMLLGKEFQTSLRNTCSNLNDLLKCLVENDDQRGLLKYHDYQITIDRNTGVYKLSILIEYLDSFNTYARKNDLTVRRVLKMCMDLCDSLQTMSNLGFPHGNIKETNIFYDNIKGFKLGDFFFNDILINTLQPRESYSDYGYRFLAPEAYDLADYSYKTDIFILAMLVYKLINNSLLPFEYEGEITSQKEIREKFLANRTLPPSDLIPAPIYDVLRRATAFNPKDRYESFLAMKEDIRNAMKDINFDELERVVDYKVTEEPNDMLPSPMQPLPKEPASVSYEISVQKDDEQIEIPVLEKHPEVTDEKLPENNETKNKTVEKPNFYVPGPNEMKILQENPDIVDDKTIVIETKKELPKVEEASNNEKKQDIKVRKKDKKNKELKEDKQELAVEQQNAAPLYSYYEDEDEDSDYGTKNWIATILFILAIAILCIALYMLIPTLQSLLGNKG